MKRDAWRLPDGIDEILPPEAWSLELLRRRVLDLFHTWGYEYIDPPLVEYLDSLLVGSGNDLELQTFRMVDQRSGRMLGIRADMTSQAARIDAASLLAAGTQRLCYAGTVVHANPKGVLESRIPLLAGAELFGADGVEADAEVVALMMAVLASAGIEGPVLELGHVGVFRALGAGRFEGLERGLFEALQRKSEPDIAALVGATRMHKGIKDFLCVLPRLIGGREVLEEARGWLSGLPAGVGHAIDALEGLADVLGARCPAQKLRFDLCELTGYGYHTGAVFTAYSPDLGRPVARGGRYDGVGAAYGSVRSATGFDVNLTRLPRSAVVRGGVWAPALASTPKGRRAALTEAIAALRNAGERVVVALASDEARAAICDRTLTFRNRDWRVEASAKAVRVSKAVRGSMAVRKGAPRHG